MHAPHGAARLPRKNRNKKTAPAKTGRNIHTSVLDPLVLLEQELLASRGCKELLLWHQRHLLLLEHALEAAAACDLVLKVVLQQFRVHREHAGFILTVVLQFSDSEGTESMQMGRQQMSGKKGREGLQGMDEGDYAGRGRRETREVLKEGERVKQGGPTCEQCGSPSSLSHIYYFTPSSQSHTLKSNS
eukprot:762402-Pelagomonas_calceolata.AAC.4